MMVYVGREFSAVAHPLWLRWRGWRAVRPRVATEASLYSLIALPRHATGVPH